MGADFIEDYRFVRGLLLKSISDFFDDLVGFFNGPTVFLGGLNSSKETFIRASMFALIVAIVMTGLRMLSYKKNGIELTWLFVSVDVFLTWCLFLLYATEVWAVNHFIFRWTASYFKTISAFFYLTAILVLGVIVAIPSRVLRDKELLGCMLSSSTVDNMHIAIKSNPYAWVSDKFIAIVYIVFFIFLIIMIKAINNKVGKVATIRAIFTAVVGLATIAVTVSWIQRPVVGTLLCAFK